MNITSVNVTRVNSDSKLEAMASVTIDNAIKIHGFKVIDGEKGYFVAMPSRTDKNGEYRDTVYPITAGARKELIEAVLDEFTRDRLERENIPDLEDAKLPWDEEPGRGDMKDPVDGPSKSKAPEAGSPAKGKAAASKEKAGGAKEKASVREQLAELGKAGEGKGPKVEKAIKPKKEEISI